MTVSSAGSAAGWKAVMVTVSPIEGAHLLLLYCIWLANPTQLSSGVGSVRRPRRIGANDDEGGRTEPSDAVDRDHVYESATVDRRDLHRRKG
jgi:hypothetical protein